MTYVRTSCWRRRLCSGSCPRAFTLLETMVAVGIFSITMLGYTGFLAFLQRQNMLDSQIEVAQAQLRERLELIKGLSSFADVRYSTTNAPAYLKRSSNGSFDTNWKLPKDGEWLAFNVEGVDPTKSDPPQYVGSTSPLPDSQWNIVITQAIGGAKITAALRWHIRSGNTAWHQQSLVTNVASNFLNL